MKKMMIMMVKMIMATAGLKKEKEIKFDFADVTLITLPLTPHDRALTTDEHMAEQITGH